MSSPRSGGPLRTPDMAAGRVGNNEWDDLVVICGTTFWTGTRLLDQHIAEHLTAYAPVLYVDPPTSVLTRFRNRDAGASALTPGLHRIGPRLQVLSPRVPPLKERPLVKQLSLAMTRRAIRATVRSLGVDTVRAVIVPSLNPLFGCVDERIAVFYAKDDYVAGAGLMGISSRRLVRRAAAQPRDADVVVAVSPTLAESLRGHGKEPLLIPNGCDVELFSAAGAPPPNLPPEVVYVGHLSDRVDVRLLEAVAETGVRLVLVGPRQETMQDGLFDRVLARSNVVWRGPVPYTDLPGVLATATTALLPYADTAFNRASFPLKALEYLAAGRRVVSTSLPAVDWLDTSLIDVADNPADFAASVTRSLVAPLEQREVDDRRAFAGPHDWSHRARRLAQALDLVGSEDPMARTDDPAVSRGTTPTDRVTQR